MWVYGVAFYTGVKNSRFKRSNCNTARHSWNEVIIIVFVVFSYRIYMQVYRGFSETNAFSFTVWYINLNFVNFDVIFPHDEAIFQWSVYFCPKNVLQEL